MSAIDLGKRINWINRCILDGCNEEVTGGRPGYCPTHSKEAYAKRQADNLELECTHNEGTIDIHKQEIERILNERMISSDNGCLINVLARIILHHKALENNCQFLSLELTRYRDMNNSLNELVDALRERLDNFKKLNADKDTILAKLGGAQYYTRDKK